MKILQAIWVALSLAFVSTSHAAQTADARMHCWSLRFQRATAVDWIGFQWRQEMTTLDSGVNGELALDFFGSGYTHSTYIELYYEWDNVTFQGAMALDAPDAGDANGNGFPDFFEVSQAVNDLESTGILDCSSYFQFVSFEAVWHRDAGSSEGYCRISVPDPGNPFQDMTFVHIFELIEYNGVLTYTPGFSMVTGLLSVARTDLSDSLHGSVVFEKSTNDPYHELVIQSAALTNDALQVLSLYTNTHFFHEAEFPTNYYGSVELVDGDPSTADADYYSWLLSIDDLNDSNGNGIPDFSDDPAPEQPRPPQLSLGRGSTNLWLTLSGDVGMTHEVQTAPAPTGPLWTTVASVTLTNDPQTISLPLPPDTTFWRASVNAAP